MPHELAAYVSLLYHSECDHEHANFASMNHYQQFLSIFCVENWLTVQAGAFPTTQDWIKTQFKQIQIAQIYPNIILLLTCSSNSYRFPSRSIKQLSWGILGPGTAVSQKAYMAGAHGVPTTREPYDGIGPFYFSLHRLFFHVIYFHLSS